MLDEASAIGTARLRAEVVDDEHGRATQQLLHDYIATRLRGHEARDAAEMAAAVDRSLRLQRAIWTHVTITTFRLRC